ncbi:MAG: helix-turn-helix domain-containing protein [Oscillospiraceae bacterium]
MASESSVNKKRGRPKKEKNINSPFAVRLRVLGAGMTHQEIADGVGIARQTIGQFFLGKTQPDIETLYKLAEFFNVSIDYLLCRTDIKSTSPETQDINKYTGLTEEAIEKLNYEVEKAEMATKEREPAPAEASASSDNKCNKRSRSYDSTLLKKCQATLNKVYFNLLDIRGKYYDLNDIIIKQVELFDELEKTYQNAIAIRKEFEEIIKYLRGEDEDDTAGI